MDNFTIHMAHLPRRYPAQLPVSQVGYLSHKRYRVRQTFQTANVSVILSGDGVYRYKDRWLPVRAPCVFMQWPGQRCDYGPHEDWEELYVIYHARLCPQLQAMRYHDPMRPLWQLRQGTLLREHLRALRDLSREPSLERIVDRVDRRVDSMIADSLLASQSDDEQLSAVERIRRIVEDDIESDHDFASLALEHGLSQTHFRRLWNRLVSCPPGRYLSRLRMRQACRELVESEKPVHLIAADLGYRDPLYFSRLFKKIIGETASDYRRRYWREQGYLRDAHAAIDD